MSRISRLRLAAGIVLGVLLFGVRDARAVVVIGGLEGTHFAGIFQSSRNLNDVGFFDVSIGSVKNRRFVCELVIRSTHPPDPGIPCQGTLSAAGVFEVIARRGVFQVHGMLEANGIARAHYRFGADEGTLLMLHQTDQPPDPAVFGAFEGSFASMTTKVDGILGLDVSREGNMGDALMMVTEMTMDERTGEVTTTNFSFDVFVSSLPPIDPDKPAMHPFVLIGLSTMPDPGVFVVMGMIGDRVARGEYMYFPMGVDNPDFMDEGTFDVSRAVGPD